MKHALAQTIALMIALTYTAFAEEPIDRSTKLTDSVTAQGRPLKIYILAGQSNMQGTAQLSTVPRMALSPESN